MRKIMFVFCLLLTSLSCAYAQDNQNSQPAAKTAEAPAHYYHLTLAVQDLGPDGKPVNTRTYFTTVGTGHSDRGSIRTGSRVPVPTAYNSGGDKPSVTQWQYIDIGINFDIHDTREEDGKLSLHVKADVSSYIPSTNAAFTAPIIRTNQWDSPLLIPIGKPTIIFTSDSLDNKGAMQVVATATAIP